MLKLGGTNVHSSVKWCKEEASVSLRYKQSLHSCLLQLYHILDSQARSLLLLSFPFLTSLSLLKTLVTTSCFLCPCFQFRYHFCSIQHYWLTWWELYKTEAAIFLFELDPDSAPVLKITIPFSRVHFIFLKKYIKSNCCTYILNLCSCRIFNSLTYGDSPPLRDGLLVI